MAFWNGQIRKLGGYASHAAMALVLSTGSAWAQDVPGDLWSVSYVKVSGADKDAVRRGLQSAADRYFYGDDVEAVLQANVQSGGTFDLSIVGPGGKVLGRRQGLSYDPGNVARSVSDAALGWMGNLGCGDGCAVATSGAAPVAPKKVDVAEAAEAALERAVAEAPKPAVEAQPIEVAKPAVPAKPVVIVEAPKVTKPVVTLPKAPKETAEVKVATKPVDVKKPRKPVAEVARPRVAAAPKADVSAAAKPAMTAATATPAIPMARAVVTPRVADAPSADTSASAPSAAQVTAPAPRVAAKPQEASVPEIKVTQPSAGTSETTSVATTTEATKPEVSVTTPSVAAAAEAPSVDATESQITTELDASEPQITTADAQEVTPGITLPSPSESSTPATVAEIAETANPAVSILTPTVPTVAAIATPTTPEVQPEETAPSVAEVEPATNNDGDGEQLALVNPQREVTPITSATPEAVEAPIPTAPEITTPAEAAKPVETETTTTVETRIAAVDPTAEGPTLANARWVGFTPAVFSGSDNKAGAWISGPFDRKQRTGWITDTATGATTRVTFIWRDGGSGSRTALLSREAAKALGLGQGDVANVAVYLPR